MLRTYRNGLLARYMLTIIVIVVSISVMTKIMIFITRMKYLVASTKVTNQLPTIESLNLRPNVRLVNILFPKSLF